MIFLTKKTTDGKVTGANGHSAIYHQEGFFLRTASKFGRRMPERERLKSRLTSIHQLFIHEILSIA